MRRERACVLVIVAALMGCHSVTPGPGEEAVIVRKPMFFGHGGVDSEPVKTGRTWVAWTTYGETVDVRPILQRVHLDDFFTADGVPLDFDATLRLRITNSVRVVQELGDQWYKQNIEPEFIRAVRDAVKKHGMNEVALNVTASDEIDAEVTQRMLDYLTSKRMPIELLEVTLGRANPPDAVKSQRIETAQQEQRLNTEKQRRLAEDQRKMAEAARASADNAYREQLGLSSAQFIALEQIKMLERACAAAGTCTFLLGEGAVPVMNVGKTRQ